MQQVKTDIVVIGGGTAGLAAALTSLEKGAKKVMLLEKRINIGGNSSMAGGFLFGAESRLQKQEESITYKEAVYKETLQYHHHDRINPRLIWALISRSGETIDWLEDQGIEFRLGMNNSHVIKGKFQAEIMQYSLAMEILAGKIKEKGGQILLRTGAKKILRGQNGEVIGVQAITKSGEDIQINCKVAILAPGGFFGNKELLRKYFNFDDFATEAPLFKGDGIKIAEDAGACLEDYCTMSQHGTHAKYISLETMKNQPNHRGVPGPCAVWINTKGIRYLNESDLPHAPHIMYQHNDKTFALVDDKIMQSPIKMEMPRPPANTSASSKNRWQMPAFKELSPEEERKSVEAVRKELKAAAKSGTDVCMADNWDDIAKYAGINPSTLKVTIEEYNTCCDRGYDAILGKDKKYLIPLRTPPFYAIKMQPGSVETIGPVRINERIEVLDKQENPIPGFYAAGAITSGWCGNDYHLFGSNLGFGTTAGRLSGENAAIYIKQK